MEESRCEAGDDKGSDSSGTENNTRDIYHTVRDEVIPSIPVQEQEAFLQNVFDELVESFPDLVFTMSQVCDADKLVPVLLISQHRLYNHVPFGAVSRIQIAVHYKSYTVNVLMRQWRCSSFDSVAEIRELCYIIEEYKFCPGINPDHYNREYYDVIRFHINCMIFHSVELIQLIVKCCSS